MSRQTVAAEWWRKVLGYVVGLMSHCTQRQEINIWQLTSNLSQCDWWWWIQYRNEQWRGKSSSRSQFYFRTARINEENIFNINFTKLIVVSTRYLSHTHKSHTLQIHRKPLGTCGNVIMKVFFTKCHWLCKIEMSPRQSFPMSALPILSAISAFFQKICR